MDRTDDKIGIKQVMVTSIVMIVLSKSSWRYNQLYYWGYNSDLIGFI